MNTSPITFLMLHNVFLSNRYESILKSALHEDVLNFILFSNMTEIFLFLNICLDNVQMYV